MKKKVVEKKVVKKVVESTGPAMSFGKVRKGSVIVGDGCLVK